MSTIGSQCVDAIVALLNEPTGRPTGLETVVRCLLSPPTPDEIKPSKKWVFVRSGDVEISEIGNPDGPLRQNDLEVLIDQIAMGDASTPADVAVDPLTAWCTKKLDGGTLSNLAEQIVERGRKRVYEQGEYPLCRTTSRFIVSHTSRTGDAEQRH
jgi:hypothetical protein